MTSTIGEQLKQAREKRGLTLVQASQSTHIRINYLEALENDQRDILPSNVQGRGFLRLYAGLLNLPIEPLLAAWDGKPYVEEPLPDQHPAAPPTPAEAEQAPAGKSRRKSKKSQKEVSDSQPAADRSQPAAEKSQPTEGEPKPAGNNSPSAARSLPWAPGESFPSPDPEPDLPPIKDPAVVSEPAPVMPAPVPEPPAAEPEPTGSRLIFREIGRQLKQQREALGLSTIEVERYTRLRTHYIDALEAGRIDDLPSPVQGRGMLSNYAEFLNMDEDALLLRFAEGLQVRRVERLPRPDPQALILAKKRRPAEQAPLWRRVLTPDLLFGFGMAAIILFFVLWSSARYFTGSRQPAVPTPPNVAEILLTPAAQLSGTPGAVTSGTPGAQPVTAEGTPAAGTAVDGAAQSGDVATGTPGAGTAAPGEAPLPEISGTPVAPQSAAEQGTPTQPAPPNSNDPLQVYIVAKQRAFLRVTADDKVKFLGRVVPGNAYSFSGNKRVELLTGSAAALQVFYNQKDLGVLGDPGQALGLVFVPAGLWTPTPAIPPTATPSKATATPTVKPTLMPTPSITPFVP